MSGATTATQSDRPERPRGRRRDYPVVARPPWPEMSTQRTLDSGVIWVLARGTGAVMPIAPENLAMIESDWPGADWNREKNPRLAGPRRGEELRAHPPGRLAKFHVPEIVFGPGALAELGHCAARLGARRPFLVSDPGLIEAGWVDEAVAYLRQSGLHLTVWHDVTPNPKDHEIEAAFARYAESGSDVIVGLGGGSCIDAAKGVAILSGNGGRILGYEGVDKGVRPLPPT